MEPTFALPQGLSKQEQYEWFAKEYLSFIKDEQDWISVLANTAASLHESFGFFWVGFYLVKDADWLHLGPFQGSVACYRIKRGRGVCGSAWAEKKTLVVPDVDAFPGHIACSSLSRSEIVVPMIVKDEVIGVLDIDSDQPATFDDDDQVGLERIVELLCKEFFG